LQQFPRYFTASPSRDLHRIISRYPTSPSRDLIAGSIDNATKHGFRIKSGITKRKKANSVQDNEKAKKKLETAG
jgi:hypothetical protein